jgi:hypothetical protein
MKRKNETNNQNIQNEQTELYKELKNKSLSEIFKRDFKDPSQYDSTILKEANVILEKTGLITFLPVDEIIFLDENEDKEYDFAYDENNKEILTDNAQDGTKELLCYYYDKYMRKEHMDHIK